MRFRAALLGAAERPWFARFAEVLELEGFAAASQDTYSVLLDWEREARAAGYDQPG